MEVAATLVKLLTHVFDPPPTAASVPWPYLVLVLIVTGGAVLVAGITAAQVGRRGVLETIRQL